MKAGKVFDVYCLTVELETALPREVDDDRMKQDESHVALFASYLITAVSSWFSRSQLQLAPSLLLKLPLLIEPRALLCSSLELVVSSWLLATRGDECAPCASRKPLNLLAPLVSCRPYVIRLPRFAECDVTE